MGQPLAHRLWPHRMLLGLRLNGESGWQVFVNLVGLEWWSKTPMVLMTELVWEPLDNEVRALSATDFLVMRKVEADTLNLVFPVAHHRVALSFREVFGIERAVGRFLLI